MKPKTSIIGLDPKLIRVTNIKIDPDVTVDLNTNLGVETPIGKVSSVQIDISNNMIKFNLMVDETLMSLLSPGIEFMDMGVILEVNKVANISIITKLILMPLNMLLKNVAQMN